MELNHCASFHRQMEQMCSSSYANKHIPQHTQEHDSLAYSCTFYNQYEKPKLDIGIQDVHSAAVVAHMQ